MFARIAEAPIQPGKKDEIVALVTKELLPYARRQQGFVGALLFESDVRANLGLIVTLWHSKQDAEGFITSPEYNRIMIPILTLTEKLTIRTYEVVASTFPTITEAVSA